MGPESEEEGIVKVGVHTWILHPLNVRLNVEEASEVRGVGELHYGLGLVQWMPGRRRALAPPGQEAERLRERRSNR